MTVNGRSDDKVLRYRWIIFAVLVAAYFLVYFHRVTPAVVGDRIVGELGGSLALIASAYFYTYLVMQLPSGLMTDRLGPRKLTFAFLMLAAIGTFLTSMAGSFPLVIAGKIMIACGMAVVYIPLTKVLAVWFRKKDFATLNGSVIAVGNVGAIAASAPLAILIGTIGWREFFFVLGIITLILALLCLILVRDRPEDIGGKGMLEIYPEDRQANESLEKVPLKSGVITAVTSGRAFWMPALGYFLVYGTIMVYQGLWVGIYFNKHYAFLHFAWLISMVGVGKIISSAMAGTLARRIGSKRTVMIFANLGYLAVWGVIWLFAGEISMFWFWMGINFMFGFFSGFMTLAFAQAKEWFPVSISGTVISLVNIMIFGGAAVMQTLSGFLVINRSLEEFSLLWMIMFACVIIACVLSYLSIDNNTGSVRPVHNAKAERANDT